MEKLNLTIDILRFTKQLLTAAEEYKEGYEEGTLSLYMHILLEMFVEGRGGESFDTLNDTGAKEQFVCYFEELLPRHTKDFQVEEKLLSDLIPLIDKHYNALKDVSPEAIVYAFLKMICVGGDLSNHITPRSVIIDELAEAYQTDAGTMTRIVNDFSTQYKTFNVYKWRHYETVDEFVSYVQTEVTRK